MGINANGTWDEREYLVMGKPLQGRLALAKQHAGVLAQNTNGTASSQRTAFASQAHTLSAPASAHASDDVRFDEASEDARALAAWNAHTQDGEYLRAEFSGNQDAYLAFERAQRTGRARIIRGSVIKHKGVSHA